MIASDQSSPPAPLTVAASLSAVEGLVLLGYGILELSNTSGERLVMGLTSALFLAGYGVALLCGAWLLSRGVSAARSPIVLTQLILLGVAWSFRGGGTTMIAIVVAVVAVLTIVGIFHPASINHINEQPFEPGD